MQDRYKSDIITLITQRGPLGVSALSKELNVAASTLQKYLHKQSYFKINEDKKWDLPENVVSDIKSNTLVLMTDLVETNVKLLKSQLEEMLQTVENAINPIETLKRGVNTYQAPVASKSDKPVQKIDSRISEIIEMEATLQSIFKKQSSNIPEEYRDLFFNFDYIGLVLKEGQSYTKEFLEEGTYALLAGKDTTLEEDVLQILKDNQKS